MAWRYEDMEVLGVLQFYSVVVLRCCGVAALRRFGIAVLRCCGVAVLRCKGVNVLLVAQFLHKAATTIHPPSSPSSRHDRLRKDACVPSPRSWYLNSYYQTCNPKMRNSRLMRVRVSAFYSKNRPETKSGASCDHAPESRSGESGDCTRLN